MRIARSHLPWILLVLLVTAVSTGLYLANYYPSLLPVFLKLPAWLGEAPPLRNTFGGTPLGLIFGTVAFAIFLFAAGLGIRKKKRRLPIGNVKFWIKAHIWLTILTIPLVAFHSGFKSGGPFTSVLMWLYVLVMGSGIFGIILQQFMPSMMRKALPREFVFEQIPFLRGQLLQAATDLRKPIAEALTNAIAQDPSPKILCTFLDEECLPYLRSKGVARGPLSDMIAAADLFRDLKVNVESHWRTSVEKLERWCDARRTMDIQTRYQHWLHGWLVVHVPTSLALLVLTAWHAWLGVQFLLTVSR